MVKLTAIGQERQLLPIVVDYEQANAELSLLGDDEAALLHTKIARTILEKKLTPLQAQAVLVKAWAAVQTKGKLG